MSHIEHKSPSNLHVDKVINTVLNPAAPNIEVPEHVHRSWRRCIDNYKITPDNHFIPYVVEQHILLEHQEAFNERHQLIRHYLDNLYDIIGANGYTLLLTDLNGITLDCRYENLSEDILKQSGLYTGSNWSETIAGTNGIGTCIAEEKSIIIDQGEHFFPVMTGMTCIVSPVFDHTGKLIASLNASILKRVPIAQNKLVAKLVKQYAKKFELLFFMEEFKEHWLLSFSRHGNASEVLSSAMIAINNDGYIVAENINAAELLHKDRGRTIENYSLKEIFDVSFSELLDNFTKKTASSSFLFSVENNIKYSYTIIPPKPVKNIPQQVRANTKTNSIQGKSKHPSLKELMGKDNKTLSIAKKINKVLDTGLHILITGETGTGKEAWARAIHNESERQSKPFIAINCAAIPESLIESELFGYNMGTFTGALKKGKKGKILEANGGTLFLDEIGDMPLLLQTRLLRVLSEFEVVPLGESTPVQLDIQLISATNQNLAKMIETNLFRADLYYRLNGVVLNLPALRYRIDKKELISSLFKDYSKSEMVDVTEEAMSLLYKYYWPGNIRQLINTIRHSIAMSQSEPIAAEHLPTDILHDNSSSAEHTMEVSEHDLLLGSLKNNKWNITLVSKELKMCRATVYRKMKKYDIVPPNVQ